MHRHQSTAALLATLTKQPKFKYNHKFLYRTKPSGQVPWNEQYPESKKEFLHQSVADFIRLTDKTDCDNSDLPALHYLGEHLPDWLSDSDQDTRTFLSSAIQSLLTHPERLVTAHSTLSAVLGVLRLQTQYSRDLQGVTAESDIGRDLQKHPVFCLKLMLMLMRWEAAGVMYQVEKDPETTQYTPENCDIVGTFLNCLSSSGLSWKEWSEWFTKYLSILPYWEQLYGLWWLQQGRGRLGLTVTAQESQFYKYLVTQDYCQIAPPEWKKGCLLLTSEFFTADDNLYRQDETYRKAQQNFSRIWSSLNFSNDPLSYFLGIDLDIKNLAKETKLLEPLKSEFASSKQLYRRLGYDHMLSLASRQVLSLESKHYFLLMAAAKLGKIPHGSLADRAKHLHDYMNGLGLSEMQKQQVRSQIIASNRLR